MNLLYSYLLIMLLFSHSFGQTSGTWITKFEKSGFLETSRYDETMEYFGRLEEESEYAKMFSFGVSPQGRDINCIVVSGDKAFTPAEAKKTGKPVILIINGIHSGEIEGKDACMLLLREMLITKEKADYLDDVILVIVPIFSVDAHERWGKYNRINQNGPSEMGWRTTAQGYNLNRDWVKADAPEMQAMLRLFSSWLPDFFVDTHTTDGADYQYPLTYGMDTHQNINQYIADFNKNKFLPFYKESVEKEGYLLTSYVYFRDWKKGFESGLSEGAAPPRFSNCYASVQNRIGLLVETHMLKPYKNRVYSTKATLETVINFCSQNKDELREVIQKAESSMMEDYLVNKKYYPLSTALAGSSVVVKFKGKAYTKIHSEISGQDKIVYSNKDSVFDVTVFKEIVISDSATAPSFYLIPKEWEKIIERMKLHGILVDSLANEESFDVTRYRFDNVRFDTIPNEGHQRVSFKIIAYREKVTVPAGTYKISSNQRTLGLILNMLEPKADDSFIKWGFFNNIFTIKEYFEDYVVEKLAIDMLNADPSLKKEFEDKLASDETFRNDPNARLEFFYKKSPYYDKEYCVYPIMRVE